MSDIEREIRRLAEYMDAEGIARALDRDVEFVRAVLSGEAVRLDWQQEEGEEGHLQGSGTPVVRYVRPAFRQRVVCVARAKGGVGATALLAGIAWKVSEKARTLVIDAAARVYNRLVASDFAGFFGPGIYEQENWDGPEVAELAENLHFLPLHPAWEKPTLGEAVLEARSDYDAVLLDLPHYWTGDVSAVKPVNTVVLLYSGGEAEAERVVRLAGSLDERKDAVLVATVQGHPLERWGGRWAYFPVSEVKPGYPRDASPALKQALNGLVAEIWGEEFAEKEKRKGGLLARVFGR